MSNNFSNFNQHDIFNYGQRPPNNNQNPIACRVCPQVFPSIPAFITHTESHLDQENLSRGRRSFSPNLINPRRQLIPSSLQPHSRTNPYPYATRIAAPPRPILPCQLLPEIIPSTVNYVAEMAQLAATAIYQEEMRISPIDGTKALITQLDKPINNNEFINMVDMIGGNHELLALNLELRL